MVPLVLSLQLVVLAHLFVRFYVTAQSKGTCEALWCRRVGASRRRRSSLFNTSLVFRVKTETDALLATPTTSPGSNGEVKYNISRERHAAQVREKVAPGPATLQAIALSTALIDEEDIASPAAGRWRGVGKQLFTTTPTPGDQMAAWSAAWGSGSLRGAALNGDSRTAEPANVNIAVVARCRPLLAREIERGVREAVFCRGDEVIVSGKKLPIKRSRIFRFDRVFGETVPSVRSGYEVAVVVHIAGIVDAMFLSNRAFGFTTKIHPTSLLAYQTQEETTRGTQRSLYDAFLTALQITYCFVAGPNISQARVYTETVAPVVRKMLDGYNCSVLAYGQTGSGKTFTMEGGLDVSDDLDTTATTVDVRRRVETLGIISRAVHTIFREGHAGGCRQYWVYVSHMEIYNERLFDLLAPDADPTTADAYQQQQPPERSPRRERSPTWSWPQSPARSSTRSPSPRPGARSPPYVENTFFGSSSRASPSREQISTPRRENSNAKHHGGGKAESAISPRSPQRMSEVSRTNRGRGVNAGNFMGRGLTIEEHPKLGVTVKGLTQVEVKSPEEIFAIVAKSKKNRRTAEASPT